MVVSLPFGVASGTLVEPLSAIDRVGMSPIVDPLVSMNNVCICTSKCSTR